jgi:hypothetical protein
MIVLAGESKSLDFMTDMVQSTEYIEWQWPLSGVHSIKMEKLAQAGEVWGVHTPPPPFTISTYHHWLVVYAPAERADTLPLFLLYPYMYSVLREVHCTVYSVLYTPHHSLIVSLQLISLPLPECECGKANTKEPILLSATPWNAGRKCTETGVLKKLILARLAKLSQLRYSWLRFGLASAGYRGLWAHDRPVYTAG